MTLFSYQLATTKWGLKIGISSQNTRKIVVKKFQLGIFAKFGNFSFLNSAA